MTPDEAQAALVKGRELFGTGRWDDLFATLQPVHEAHGLEGTDGGEAAFYLGEACLGLERPADAVPYLEEAASTANVDFGPWAQEELARARAMLSGAAPSGDTGPGATLVAADQAYAAQDVDTALSLYEQAYNGGAQGDDLARAALGIARCKALRNELPDARWYAEYAMNNSTGQVAADAHALLQWIDEQQQPAAPAPEAPAAPTAPHAGGGPQQQDAPQQQPTAPDAGATPSASDRHPEGTPDPSKPFTPAFPSADTPDGPVEVSPVSGEGSYEIKKEFKIGKDVGPVTIENVTVKAAGKLATSEGTYATIGVGGSNLKGGGKVELPIDAWNDILGTEWDAKLKGSVDVGSESGMAGTLEFTNGHARIDVQFTIIKYADGKLGGLELSVMGGAQVENKPVVIAGETFYFSGAITIGPTIGPNWEWIMSRIGEGAAETAAPAAGEGIATGIATIGAEGAATLGAGLLLMAAQGYAFYKGVLEQQALSRLRDDSELAVDHFVEGFMAGVGVGNAPGDEWGKAGMDVGQQQFEANWQAFVKHEEDQGKKLAKEDEASMRDVFKERFKEDADKWRAEVRAAFDQMVRTVIFKRWMKANEGVSLGDITPWALTYCGLKDGPVDLPDMRSANAAGHTVQQQHNADWVAQQDPADQDRMFQGR